MPTKQSYWLLKQRVFLFQGFTIEITKNKTDILLSTFHCKNPRILLGDESLILLSLRLRGNIFARVHVTLVQQ